MMQVGVEGILWPDRMMLLFGFPWVDPRANVELHSHTWGPNLYKSHQVQNSARSQLRNEHHAVI